MRMSLLIVGALLVLLIYVTGLAHTASQVQGTEAYTPIIEAGEVGIDVSTQTICWTVADCTRLVEKEDINSMKSEPQNFDLTDSRKLIITFKQKPLPQTVNLQIEELPQYSEQWSYSQRDSSPLLNYFSMLRNKPIHIELPKEPGTYTYNMLVYWHGNKAATQGIANYRFRVTVK